MNEQGGLNRRDFLRLALGTTVAAVPLAWTGNAAAARPAHAGRRIPRAKLGVQLYTLRSIMAEDVEGTLEAVADLGYREVEFAGLYGYSPEEMRELIESLKLKAPSSHDGLDQLRGDNLQPTLERAKTLGQRWVILPYFRSDSLDDYRQVAEDLNVAGEAARKHGLRVGYHNHDFEFEPIDGVRPYDLLLAETDPKLVDMEMDIYWVVVAGVDPVAYFEEHPRRFPLVHVKDMAPDGSFADVGEGTIDFERIFDHRAEAGIRHYVVEHDNPPDPLASIEDSYEYLRDFRF